MVHTRGAAHVLYGVVDMLGHVGQGACWSAWLMGFPAVLVFVECCGCFAFGSPKFALMLGNILDDEVIGPRVISTNIRSQTYKHAIQGQAVQACRAEGIFPWEICHLLTS